VLYVDVALYSPFCDRQDFFGILLGDKKERKKTVTMGELADQPYSGSVLERINYEQRLSTKWGGGFDGIHVES